MELNIYGDISGGTIFDMMDREAHRFAVKKIGPCVTASANINYFHPIKELYEDIIITIDGCHEFTGKLQVYVSVQHLLMNSPYATASFLFIAKKNHQ